MRFYLGTHEVSWLGRTSTPLFLSRIRLARQKSWARALGPWALDSGGYSQLSTHGEWTITPKQYVEEVRRWSEEIGPPDWAACMDYMCEPNVREKTGLTVVQHQGLTIKNYLTLRDLAPEIPWAPVLQGQTVMDYWHHADCWDKSGVDLRKAPAVPVGSICRLQATKGVRPLLATLRADGIKLHGLGLKRLAFKGDGVLDLLASADSLAWSDHARWNEIRLPGHTHVCSSCLDYATQWLGDTIVNMISSRPARWQKGWDDDAAANVRIESDHEANLVLRFTRRFHALTRMAFDQHADAIRAGARNVTIDFGSIGLKPTSLFLSEALPLHAQEEGAGEEAGPLTDRQLSLW